MKTFTNVNPKDFREAVKILGDGRNSAVLGGGSDMLGMVKEHLVQPDVLVHLRGIKGEDKITPKNDGVHIGGLITLDDLSHDPMIRKNYAVLAEAAENVATPQIRNVGTLAGNVCQRPWCWYFRNGFPCFKAGGNKCFSASGEHQLHAIFGGGPSFIVHPSDTAPALVALDAKFHILGPKGERTIPAAEFFVLPRVDSHKENVLAKDELLIGFELPAVKGTVKSTYHKVLDREAWTHAVISVAVALETDNGICKSARVVLGGVAPIPWRLPKVEALLAGKKITPELAEQAGQAAIQGATPLAKNRYKVPLTKATVRRTLESLA